MAWGAGVLAFGAVLAGGAFEVTTAPIRWMLESLQGSEIIFNPVLRFSLGVMGCVTIGWAITVLSVFVAAFNLPKLSRPLWLGVSAGVTVWFVTDSALSLATGFPLNVVPNSVLLVAYFIPLIAGDAFGRKTATDGR